MRQACKCGTEIKSKCTERLAKGGAAKSRLCDEHEMIVVARTA
jgi:hypothetical protein